jgi:hypothetical protein
LKGKKQNRNAKAGFTLGRLLIFLVIPVIFPGLSSCESQPAGRKVKPEPEIITDLSETNNSTDESQVRRIPGQGRDSVY